MKNLFGILIFLSFNVYAASHYETENTYIESVSSGNYQHVFFISAFGVLFPVPNRFVLTYPSDKYQEYRSIGPSDKLGGLIKGSITLGKYDGKIVTKENFLKNTPFTYIKNIIINDKNIEIYKSDKPAAEIFTYLISSEEEYFYIADNNNALWERIITNHVRAKY